MKKYLKHDGTISEPLWNFQISIFVRSCAIPTKETLEQWFSTFLLEQNPGKHSSSSRAPLSHIHTGEFKRTVIHSIYLPSDGSP